MSLKYRDYDYKDFRNTRMAIWLKGNSNLHHRFFEYLIDMFTLHIIYLNIFNVRLRPVTHKNV